jgi:hypothetical protein
MLMRGEVVSLLLYFQYVCGVLLLIIIKEAQAGYTGVNDSKHAPTHRDPVNTSNVALAPVHSIDDHFHC